MPRSNVMMTPFRPPFRPRINSAGGDRRSRSRGVAAAVLAGSVLILAIVIMTNGAVAAREGTWFTLDGPEPVTSLRLDSNASHLAVCRGLTVSFRGGDRGSFSVYRTAPAERILTLNTGPADDSAFVPQKERAVVTSGSAIRLIELSSGREIWEQSDRKANLAVVAVLAKNEVILCCDGTANGGVRLYSLADGRSLGLREHPLCQDVLTTKSGDWYSVGGGILRKWHQVDAEPVAELALSPSGVVQRLIQLPAGDLLVGNSGTALQIRDADSLKLKKTIDLTPTGLWWPILSSDAESVIIVADGFISRIGIADSKVLARRKLKVAPTSVAPTLFEDFAVIAHHSPARKQAVGLFRSP